ncbi:condensin-2 complex subunit G2-like isoform X1 [Branchiostoma floridae x Branchiostoma belcheri]
MSAVEESVETVLHRDKFLQVLKQEAPSADSFANYLKLHDDRNSQLDLLELYQALNRRQVLQLWTSLQQVCNHHIMTGPFTEDDPQLEQLPMAERKQVVKKAVDIVQGVITMATIAISQESPVVPDTLEDTVLVLHGVLPSLPEAAVQLKTQISTLCEKWWQKDLRQKENVVYNAMIFFLKQSLEFKAKAISVRRVWGLRQVLNLFSYQDETMEELQRLLMLCVINKAYLGAAEGRRFLTFLFGLHPNFTDKLHKTIKNQLPAASKTVLKYYGEIYFHAWNISDGLFREKVEICLQDLMYLAIHANRSGPKPLSENLQLLLSSVHQQKHRPGVDDMLYTLYKPILWRSLKVANAAVRTNAALLLVDAFPLQIPDAPVEERDQNMQKQMDILWSLLEDPEPMLRMIAVRGVCRIVGMYWELIPTTVVQDFLKKVIDDMANDCNSADVRAAVFKGIMFVLEQCPLSHPVLKTMLPRLRNNIHDKSEKVRLAFAQLLLKVKSVRAIKFWDVVPLDHIMARIAVDKTPTATILVTLLFNSFVPLQKDNAKILERAIYLVEENPQAARRFFQLAPNCMAIGDTVKYMLLLCHYVWQLALRALAADPNNTEENLEDKENVSDEELTVADTNTMAGLLEAMALLWSASTRELSQPGNGEWKQKLRNKFARCLPDFLKVFHDARCHHALVQLACFLKADTIPTFSCGVVSKLKGMTWPTPAVEFGPLVTCLANWGRLGDVLELVTEWLTVAMDGEKAEDNNKEDKKGKKKKRVMFVDPHQPQPMLALDMLDYILSEYLCRECALEVHTEQLDTISDKLQQVLACIDDRLMTGQPLTQELLSDDFLLRALQSYCLIQVHLQQKNETPTSEFFSQILDWAEHKVVPSLSHPDNENTQGATNTVSTGVFAVNVIQTVLQVAGDLVLLCLLSDDQCCALLKLAGTTLSTDSALDLLSPVCMLTCRVVDVTAVSPHDNRMQDLVPRVLESIIQTQVYLVRRQKENARQRLQEMKSSFQTIVRAHVNRRSLNQNLRQDFMATIMTAVVAEMTSAVRKGAEFGSCDRISDLPTLSAFLLSTVNINAASARLFVEELSHCAESGALQGLPGHYAAAVILHTLQKDGWRAGRLKDCADVVKQQAQNLAGEEQEGEGEDSAKRKLLEEIANLTAKIQG